MPRSPEAPDPSLPLEAERADDELEDWELGELLDSVTADDADPYDTEEASDLDIGFDAASLEEGENDDEPTLDVGSDTEDLLPVDEGGDDPDESEAIDVTLADGLPDVEQLPLGDDEEGPESTFADLPDLPELVREDERDDALEPQGVPPGWAGGDEPRPAWSSARWTELVSLPLEPCSALAIADGVVVAASSDLFWFGPGSLTPLRLEAGSSQVRSLALCATGWEYAICATASGRLFRRGRLLASSEELRDARELSRGATGPERFELCQPGSAFPHAILVRSARGQLLRSDDDGLTFRHVTDRRVRALGPRGAPALALTADGTLLRSDDGGGNFEELRLPAELSAFLEGSEPLLAGLGDVVVLAEASAGVAISSDGGRSFRRVPGTTGVSAVSVEEIGGARTVWAALYDEVDRTWIARIDPLEGRAETIALVAAAANDDADDDSGERARVARIEFEPLQGRLWLAGGFGVKIFVPPTSATA